MGGIRVVARIRPLQDTELERDCIVSAASNDHDTSSQPTLVRIPSSKNENEIYSFQFSSVYDEDCSQQIIFDNESESNWSATLPGPEPNTAQFLQQLSISSMDSTLQSSLTVSRVLARHIQCVAGSRWQTEG